MSQLEGDRDALEEDRRTADLADLELGEVQDPGAQKVTRAKARVYLVASVLGTVMALSVWVARASEEAFVAVVYPLLAAVLLFIAVGLLTKRLSVWLVERIALWTVAGVFMARLGVLLHGSESLEAGVAEAVESVYPLLIVSFIIAYIVFDSRRGLLASLVILVGAIGLALSAAIPAATAGESVPWLALGRSHGFMGVAVALLAGLASLKEQLEWSRARAEVLREQACTDPLTGLANRRLLYDMLAKRIDEATRYGRPFCVIIIDLDHFKQINDVHGHDVGDEVLREVSELLTDGLRQSDTVARWGGEEFLIMAPEGRFDEAMRIAERCRRQLADRRIAGLQITASFGVAEYVPGETLSQVVQRADEALYRAKEEGRNRVEAAPAG